MEKNKYKITLGLINNPSREKFQSEWAFSIVEAVRQAERHNPGYFCKSIIRFENFEDNVETNKYHIIISCRNSEPIDLIANNNKTKDYIDWLYSQGFFYDSFAKSVVKLF